MNNLYDLIIVGSGPAGISAAIYAARAKLKTLMIDSGNSGGQIRITSEIVNYPGILNISGAEFSDTMRKQAESFGAETLHAQVEKMELKEDIKKVHTSKGVYEAVGVIIATGAVPRTLGFDGEQEFKGRGIGYCATCDGEFFTGKDVFVIGAGFAAAEESIFLTRYAKKVHIIAREPEFTCSKTIADKVLANPNIEVHFNSEIKSATGNAILQKAVFINNETKEEWTFEDEKGFGIFVFVGYVPMSSFVKDQIDVDKFGYVPTTDGMETNLPGVYAAGDIRPKMLRQLVTAVSDGAIASTNAEKYIDHKKEQLGVTIEAEKPKKSDNFFTDELSQQLAPVLERFTKSVKIVGIVKQDDQISSEIISFLQGLEKLNKYIEVKLINHGEDQGIESTINAADFPVIALFDENDNYTGLSYCAVPGGHEFNSFILALYNIAGPGQTISDDLSNRIKNLKKLDIKVGMSLSCTMCPDVVQAIQQIVLKNENLTGEIIDITKYADFRNQYNIMSVPAIVVNDKEVSFGKKSLEELVLYLEQIK